MTKEREALRMSLRALEKNTKHLPVHFDYHFEAIRVAKKVLEQPPEERNFCPRCGKRAGKNAWDVHTCSLPEENT
jgi:hypothetical protein